MADDTFSGGDISAAMTAATGDSPAPGPDTSTPPAVSASADTTVPPDGISTPASSTTQSTTGEPPKERWPDILSNARTKAIEEATAQWKDYEFVRGIPADLARDLYEDAVQSGGDPIQLVQRMTARIAADPVHGPALRSFAAKQLAAGRRTAAPAVETEQEPQPDAEIVNEHGQVVGLTFSAAQQAKREAWLKRQWMGEVSKEIEPLKQSHEKAIAHEREVVAKAEAAEWSGGFGKELTAYPGFQEHKTEIGTRVLDTLKRLQPNDPRGNDPVFLEAITLRAYNAVVLPKLQQTERRAVVQDIHHKANAGSIGHPTAQPTAAPSSLKDLSWNDALAREWQRVTG
jgi:hypothetical protein